MFNKIKAVLVVLIFAYVGFLGWKHFSGKPIHKPSFLTSASDDSADPRSGEEEIAEVPDNLSPLQEIRLGLSQVETAVFAPLKSGEKNRSAKLKSLWSRSEMQFKRGEISENDAKNLSALIVKLNDLSKERQLYVNRYEQLDEINNSKYKQGVSTVDKKKFAEKELNRQWREWVEINRPGTRSLFYSLSE